MLNYNYIKEYLENISIRAGKTTEKPFEFNENKIIFDKHYSDTNVKFLNNIFLGVILFLLIAFIINFNKIMSYGLVVPILCTLIMFFIYIKYLSPIFSIVEKIDNEIIISSKSYRLTKKTIVNRNTKLNIVGEKKSIVRYGSHFRIHSEPFTYLIYLMEQNGTRNDLRSKLIYAHRPGPRLLSKDEVLEIAKFLEVDADFKES